jgi:hypothetical protein
MNRARFMAAVLAAAAMFGCSHVQAQPRAEPEINFKALEPVTDPVQIAEWLHRLTGRFKYDGMIQMGACAQLAPAEGGPPPPPSDMCQGMGGISDCVSVGSGPGVQCILNVTWQDIYAVDHENGSVTELMVSYLDPAMELYGLDPGRAAINRLVVNNKGIGEAGVGSIKGNVATFKSPCANTPLSDTGERCFRTVRIEVKPESKLLWMWFGTQYEMSAESTYAVMTLRRVTNEEERAPSLKPASLRRK